MGETRCTTARVRKSTTSKLDPVDAVASCAWEPATNKPTPTRSAAFIQELPMRDLGKGARLTARARERNFGSAPGAWRKHQHRANRSYRKGCRAFTSVKFRSFPAPLERKAGGVANPTYRSMLLWGCNCAYTPVTKIALPLSGP